MNYRVNKTTILKLVFILFQVIMSNNHRTFIHFDYGGNYLKSGDEVQWISSEEVRRALLMKAPIEEINYLALVDKIGRKMMLDTTTSEMRFSYMPISVNPKKPIYISNDDDLLCYLEWNKIEFSVLHVELVKDDGENQRSEQIRVSEGGEVGASNKEFVSCGITRRDHDDVMILYESELCEQNKQVENSEAVACEEQEEMACEEWEEMACVEREDGMDNQGIGVCKRVKKEWEDGVNLTIGQEFGSKKAVQDLLEKGAHKNCFEYDIMKSDPMLYVVKCTGKKFGCKWFVRVAKVRNSECFLVRTYNKMHSCYRSTTSTQKIKEKARHG